MALEFVRIGKLLEDGQADEAWRAANNLYGEHPNESTPNYIIALILAENNQKSEALPYAEAAVKFAPEDAIKMVFLGKLYVDLKMIEFAPGLLHKAFSIDGSLSRHHWPYPIIIMKLARVTRLALFGPRN